MKIDQSLFEPGMTAVTSAASWVEAVLLGSVATALCVAAVALLGMSMLTGRLSMREGVRVLLGCFVLMGAPLIAGALMREASGVSSSPADLPATSPNTRVETLHAPAPYDPYAGASVLP